MVTGVPRAALLAVVVLLLASSLAALGPARAGSTPTYTLLGYVEGPGGSNALPVPAGVTVVLTSSATQQTYSTTTTLSSGQFSFSSSGNAQGLQPGWWQISVPPQTHVALSGIPGQWAVLPQNVSPSYTYLNATVLTTNVAQTLRGVSVVQENVTVNGTVLFQGKPFGGAQVRVLSPTYNGFVLASNTSSTITNKTLGLTVGYYSLEVPWGNWILETVVPRAINYYNDTALTINAGNAPATGNLTKNPVVDPTTSFTTWGYITVCGKSGLRDPNGGNVTVFNTANGAITHQTIVPGGFYQFGTTGPGTYEVFLSTVGYTTVAYSVSPTTANPSGSSPINVCVAPWSSPPANYTTVLNWSSGFGKLNVSTNTQLGNDSVFPQLPNASVGQLWVQLGLDYLGVSPLMFNNAMWPSVQSWIQSQGPFFPAGQSGTTVNGTGYGQPTNYTLTTTSGCATSCGIASSAGATLAWKQAYNLTGKVGTNLKSYPVTFNFKHPTNAQSFNYTVVLPKGYVLAAGTTVPAQAALVAAGPSGTWTTFTLVSKPSPGPSGTFSFNAVKNGTMTASVNVSANTFTWSSKNVLNQSRGNYTAIAGTEENLTFSGLNSIFPAGTNGTLYAWDFGGGAHQNTTNATTNHTYASVGTYRGSLTVTSSGGAKSSVPFTIYVGSQRPSAVISVNHTNVQTSGGVQYLVVNSSTALQFNASMSTSVVNAGAGSPAGPISVAYWNITSGTSSTWNYSASTGANPLGNVTDVFNGQGAYVTQGTWNHTNLGPSFDGWQYNVTLTVWGYGGLNSTTHLILLVKDAQKPIPIITLKNGAGKAVPSSGLVEGANHTALVVLWATNSSDPNNGSIVSYHWKITDSGNTSVNQTIDRTASPPGYPVPSGIPVWLPPQQGAYTMNLTVTDRAANTAYVTQTLVVAVNLSKRPVLTVGNLSAPSSMTIGTSYTITANVTNLGGANSTAQNVSVRFYLLPPSGSGSPIVIAGSPASVTFYKWTSSTTLNGTSAGTGSIAIPYNTTYQVLVHFTPGRTGTWDVWINATASNEFAPDYRSGQNQAHVQVTLNQSNLVGYEEDAGIAAVVLAVILLVYFVGYKKVGRGGRLRGASAGKGGSSGRLERGSKKDEDDDE